MPKCISYRKRVIPLGPDIMEGWLPLACHVMDKFKQLSLSNYMTTSSKYDLSNYKTTSFKYDRMLEL